MSKCEDRRNRYGVIFNAINYNKPTPFYRLKLALKGLEGNPSEVLDTFNEEYPGALVSERVQKILFYTREKELDSLREDLERVENSETRALIEARVQIIEEQLDDILAFYECCLEL